MPIYEFYCAPCHRLFQFFSGRIDTRTPRHCPECKDSTLKRQLSVFSTPRAGPRARTMDLHDQPVDARAARSVADRLASVDPNDHRASARLARELYHVSGAEVKENMSEALAQMEAGRDPLRIEEDFGDAIDAEQAADKAACEDADGPLVSKAECAPTPAYAPIVDERLFDLETCETLE